MVAGVRVSEVPPQPGFEVIVGMDVIAQGDFSITSVDGKTCVSYRYPSIKEIDYVAEAERIRYAGVGRNDPCPCGSGEKFKKCHGKKGGP